MSELNELGQRVGAPVAGWAGARLPANSPLVGRYARVEPLCAVRHGRELYDAQREDREGRNWTYLSLSQPPDWEAYRAWLEGHAKSTEPRFYAILSEDGAALGVAAYLRMQPESGSIEVGHLNFSPQLQRTRVATEAMVLMMRHVFDDLGYRRYEWKCDHLNAPSRAAAVRYGFQEEGVFRCDRVVKGRNRDTAWFSIIESEWPALSKAFQDWLAPDNFDADGRQRRSLSSFRL